MPRQTLFQIGTSAVEPGVYRLVRDAKQMSDDFRRDEWVEQGLGAISKRFIVLKKPTVSLREASPFSREDICMRRMVPILPGIPL